MTRPRLLLVDDETQLHHLLRILAKKSQMECFTFTGVESAWNALESIAPNLVLLDMNLSDGRGVDFLRRLHSQSGQNKFPTALFLHAGLWNDLTEGWKAGADFLVYKDLVTKQTAWEERIQEILQSPHGQPSLDMLQIQDRSRISSKEHGLRLLKKIFAQNLFREMGEPMIVQLLRRAKESLQRARFASDKLSASSTTERMDEYYLALLHGILIQIWSLFGRSGSDALTQRIRDFLSPRTQSFVHS